MDSAAPARDEPGAATLALWRDFHRELVKFARARVPTDDIAHDVVQTAFLRAHTELTAGKSPQNPRAWLYQIARNLVVDSHRQAVRDQRLAVAAEEVAQPDAIDDRRAFELVAQALPMFIEALEPPYRDALKMTELVGLTQAEAARRAGVSLSGMKSRVQRARKKVRDALMRCCEIETDARGKVTGCNARNRCDCAS